MKRQILIMFTFFLIFTVNVVAQKMTVKDSDSNVLMEVNDEGTKGSITLSKFAASTGPTTPTDKLYNVDGALYWNGSQLGTAGSAGGWTDGGTNVYLTTSTDSVGIGTTSPGAKLEVAGTAGTDGIKFPDGSLQTRAVRIFRSQVATGSIGNNTWLPGSITFDANAGDQVTLQISYSGRPDVQGYTYVDMYLDGALVSATSDEQPGTYRRTISGTVHLTIGTTGSHTFTAFFQCGSSTSSMSDGSGEWPNGGLSWTVIVGG